MRKTFILMALMLGLSSYAQEKFTLKNVDKVTFYGVDFSNVKAFLAEESPTAFQTAFDGINKLFYTEANKYNLTKFLKKKTEYSLKAVNKINKETDFDNIFTEDNKNEIKKETIQEMIKKLSIEEKEGVGLIFIAELLDKAAKQGHYQVVFFDISSKEILNMRHKTGAAQGFGLRNFWARSVFEVLKSL